jgi:hypothetical protein
MNVDDDMRFVDFHYTNTFQYQQSYRKELKHFGLFVIVLDPSQAHKNLTFLPCQERFTGLLIMLAALVTQIATLLSTNPIVWLSPKEIGGGRSMSKIHLMRRMSRTKTKGPM